ncbi:MAG: DUF3800 domain-containing protein [Armatimonadota bacterium]
MKYRIYIDEVGNPDIDSSSNPNHRFLSLTGVILELSYITSTVFPQIEALKAQFFSSHPDEPVVFHRKEMINYRYPFESLRDEQHRESFDQALLERLDYWDYTVISVCLDKKKHKETYTTWRYDPYHYCLAMLIERFVLFLRRHHARGDVMAESRGGHEDRRLKDSFARLWLHGTDFLEPEILQQALTSKELKVKSKLNNISGLQIADLLAHPSRCEILCEQNLLGRELAPFSQRVINILANKYDQIGGKIFGKKFL